MDPGESEPRTRHQTRIGVFADKLGQESLGVGQLPRLEGVFGSVENRLGNFQPRGSGGGNGRRILDEPGLSADERLVPRKIEQGRNPKGNGQLAGMIDPAVAGVIDVGHRGQDRGSETAREADLGDGQKTFIGNTGAKRTLPALSVSV